MSLNLELWGERLVFPSDVFCFLYKAGHEVKCSEIDVEVVAEICGGEKQGK